MTTERNHFGPYGVDAAPQRSEQLAMIITAARALEDALNAFDGEIDAAIERFDVEPWAGKQKYRFSCVVSVRQQVYP